jgi:hypothetical protein
MTSMNTLAELHVRQFMSQQKRQDELNKAPNDAERPRRRRYNGEAIRGPQWRQAAINSAGPLGLLDAVGQAEESWLEIFEHAPRCELPEVTPWMQPGFKPRTA